MNYKIKLMHNVWDGLVKSERQPTGTPTINFDEIISSVFSAGPFYFYTIDFYDMSISNISSGFEETHGIAPEEIKTINDILALVHPEDMDHVAMAEKKAFDLIYKSIGVDKITRYKECYNFRFKTADGSYQLYNHQSLILTVDENGNFIKSLNIHTNISHLTKENNHKFSLIGLAGEPSYLDLDVYDESEKLTKQMTENIFSKREIEIIRMIVKGFETNDIMKALFISKDTVKSHRKNILKKARCKNGAELAARAVSESWI
jgi:DNA-binding CsgD family transcriptional regulator